MPDPASHPPRPISLGTRAGIFFHSPLAVIGLFFFLFGAAMAGVFASSADFSSVLHFSERDPLAKGIVTSVSNSNASENDEDIFEYAYRFTVGSQSYQGKSFELGEHLDPGDEVQVKYVEGNPRRSRIDGMRAAPFKLNVLGFVGIFPAVGLGMLYFAGGTVRKHINLVRNGILTSGKVVRMEETSTSINDQPVFEVFFQFRLSDGTLQEASVRTHKTGNLGDEVHEPLVYDAGDPASAVLLDALPAKLRRILGA